MPKVRWVMWYGFCSKFHTLSNNAKKLENRLIFDKVRYREFKGGNLFETQCRMKMAVAVCCRWLCTWRSPAKTYRWNFRS